MSESKTHHKLTKISEGWRGIGRISTLKLERVARPCSLSAADSNKNSRSDRTTPFERSYLGKEGVAPTKPYLLEERLPGQRQPVKAASRKAGRGTRQPHMGKFVNAVLSLLSLQAILRRDGRLQLSSSLIFRIRMAPSADGGKVGRPGRRAAA